MNDCDRYQEYLSMQADGELSPDEEAALREHLASCPGCRALAEDMKLLHDGFAGLEIVAPEGFTQDVMAKIRAYEASRRKVVPLFRRPWVRAMAGAAACVVLAVGIWRSGFRGWDRPVVVPDNPSASGSTQTDLPEPDSPDIPDVSEPEPVQPENQEPVQPQTPEVTQPEPDPEVGTQNVPPAPSGDSQNGNTAGTAEKPARPSGNVTAPEEPPADVQTSTETEPAQPEAPGAEPPEGAEGQNPGGEENPVTQEPEEPADPDDGTSDSQPGQSDDLLVLSGENSSVERQPETVQAVPVPSEENLFDYTYAANPEDPGITAASGVPIPPMLEDSYPVSNTRYYRVPQEVSPSAQVIGNTKSLSSFLEQLDTDELNGVTSEYNEDYFEKQSLIAIVLQESGQTVGIQICEDYVTEDRVTIQKTDGSGENEEPASWVILAEVPTGMEDGQPIYVVYVN